MRSQPNPGSAYLGILQRRELILTLHFHTRELVHGQEWEAVKDELFELDAIRLVWLDRVALLVDGRNLLPGNVVWQAVRPLGDGVEEVEAVVVVDDVGGAEFEQAGVFWILGLCWNVSIDEVRDERM